MQKQSQTLRARLILFASALNVAGILCLSAATRAVWCGAGFGINLLTVWKVGVACEAAREKV